MQELRLLGVHRDEEHLLLVAANGTKYRLVIDSALRAALRRVPARVEAQQSRSQPSMSPREIQAHIRAGATAEDVAKLADLPLSHVQRYEGPVLAERQHVCALAGKHQIRSTHGGDHSTYLADVVADRLEAREADDHVEWDAWRLETGTWLVQLSFRTAQTDRRAQWSYHPQRAHLEPLDDEARWFSHLEDAPPPAAYDPSRQVQPGAEVTAITSAQRESAQAAAKPEPSFATTDALMEHLQAQRSGVTPHEGAPRGSRFGPARAAAMSARSAIEHQHGADPRPGAAAGLRAVAGASVEAAGRTASHRSVAEPERSCSTAGPDAAAGDTRGGNCTIDVTDAAQARREAHEDDATRDRESTEGGTDELSATVVPLPASRTADSATTGGDAGSAAGETVGRVSDQTAKDDATSGQASQDAGAQPRNTAGDSLSGDGACTDSSGQQTDRQGSDAAEAAVGSGNQTRQANTTTAAASTASGPGSSTRGVATPAPGEAADQVEAVGRVASQAEPENGTAPTKQAAPPRKQRAAGRQQGRSDSARNKRPKVPSWDEIMFGSRKD